MKPHVATIRFAAPSVSLRFRWLVLALRPSRLHDDQDDWDNLGHPEKGGDVATTPFPLALVVCDHIWRDPYSGKVNLLGTFNAIASTTFPLIQPVLSVYVALTDGQGEMEVRLRLIDVDDASEPIFDFNTAVNFGDPRIVGEIEFSRTHVAFPVPGEYRLQLYANHEFLMERRLIALHMGHDAPPPPPPPH